MAKSKDEDLLVLDTLLQSPTVTVFLVFANYERITVCRGTERTDIEHPSSERFHEAVGRWEEYAEQYAAYCLLDRRVALKGLLDMESRPLKETFAGLIESQAAGENHAS